MNKICQNIKIDAGLNVCDLGSRDGRILFTLSQYNKNYCYYTGIERGVIPFLISKINLFKNGSKNIYFINQDFLKTDLSKFNVLITYLYPSLMNAILPKLNNELKNGTVLYSIDFE